MRSVFTQLRKAGVAFRVAMESLSLMLHSVKWILLPLALLHATVAQAEREWLPWLSPELRVVQREIAELKSRPAMFDEPRIGHTVPEFGIQHRMMEAPPVESPWVQLDLGQSCTFDTVAILPALIDFHSITQSAYAFPLRFRLDASDEERFTTFTALLVQTEVDFSQSSIAPVIVHTPGVKARYLRLTVTKLAEVEGRWTFALSELMVMAGNRNIAVGTRVSHLGGSSLPPRWQAQNLTDGRTPLGPPIDRSTMPEFDALFATLHDSILQPWMVVDLGKEWPLDEVRLHPLHARQGADVPGFAFPARLRVELSTREDFSDAKTILDTPDKDFQNPGNNPVTIPARGQTARYIRIVMLSPYQGRADAFALSEVEAYSRGRKISQAARVMSSGDPKRNPPRPLSQLTDGLTSYGTLMELPQWLLHWETSQHRQTQLAALDTRSIILEKMARQRLAWLVVIITASTLLGLAYLSIKSRSKQLAEQRAFRNQLAQDLHDEIGSNLAGIAVISEFAARDAATQQDDLEEINRIARETTDAMREVLWLVGARQEMGIDLMEHLQLVAKRLLTRHEVRWLHIAEAVPPAWTTESRRQVFLFFKEALTNIVRHAKATHVELTARVSAHEFELLIQDNGLGFDLDAAAYGMGLASLRERSKQLKGTFSITSTPQLGTTLKLQAPLPN